MIFRRSVSSITKSLSKMASRLEDHAEAQLAKRDFHHAEMDRHQDHANDAIFEANRAQEVAGRIHGLLG